ncbi:hypothetical protein [Paraburkholderia phenazinium]|jgi:hypothetical protein|uniref:Uncharacterized protein n=1 Tax=Paraburkholderia phenazinium TaxID=60549 RepID=A0A1G7UQP3_9BURK|nr:hypothetical protein [Paraburkholderia phenazinium]SDG49449.1 hypothetical protein SAMN05216466_103548 [Paraburkholderia phenazinium]
MQKGYKVATLLIASILICHSVSGAPVGHSANLSSDADTISIAQGTAQRQAAEEGLTTLANRLTATANQGRTVRIMDVEDYNELRNATIGYGFQVNLIDPRAILAGSSIASSTYPGGEWRFVVMLGNRPVGLITVAKMRDHWQMVSAGASGLAQEVSRVVSRYANQVPPPQLRFIRSPQGVADFVEIASPAAGQSVPQYVPLSSARAMLGEQTLDANQVPTAIPESQILPDLRTSIRRGLRPVRLMQPENSQ